MTTTESTEATTPTDDQTPRDWVLTLIREKTDPSDAESRVWYSKPDVKFQSTQSDQDTDDVMAAFSALRNDGALFYWHGLVTLADTERLKRVVSNEVQSGGVTRKILVGKANTRLKELRDESNDEDDENPQTDA